MHPAVEQQASAERQRKLEEQGEHHDDDVVLDGAEEDRVGQRLRVVVQADELVERPEPVPVEGSCRTPPCTWGRGRTPRRARAPARRTGRSPPAASGGDAVASMLPDRPGRCLAAGRPATGELLGVAGHRPTGSRRRRTPSSRSCRARTCPANMLAISSLSAVPDVGRERLVEVQLDERGLAASVEHSLERLGR